MSIVSDFLDQKELRIIKRYTNCHNLVYKVKDKDSSIFILKTSNTDDSNVLLGNEIDWLKRKGYLEKRLSIRIPSLVNSAIFKGRIFIILEFIEGVSLLDKFFDKELDNEDLRSLAHFTQEIESIDYIETLRSREKDKLSESEWDKIFKRNLKNWYTEIIKNASSKTRRIIKIIHEKSKGFKTQDVGYAGIHGSPKLEEFIIDKNDNLYVVDWEKASSVYINFYQTSSIASHLLIKLKDSDLTQQYLYSRRQLLDKKDKNIWNKHFIKVFCQRLLGDLWDLSKRGELESVLELPIEKFIS